MQSSEVANRINATKLYYLNLLGRLMLRPLLVTLGGDTGVASKPTSPLPTPNAPPPGCLIACFLGGLFDTGLEACFLFFRGSRTGLASSLSLSSFEPAFGPSLPSPSPFCSCPPPFS
jgi:hypothetical protein